MQIEHIKGISSLIGGFLVELMLGYLIIFGIYPPYISSRLRNHNQDIDVVQVGLIYPILQIFFNLGMIIGSRIQQKIDLRIIILIAAIMHSLCFVGLSFVDSFAGYVVLYGVVQGFALGLPYILPLGNALKYFPNRKGLCCGILQLGIGIGGVIFNQIIQFATNPNNQKPDNTQLFPSTVTNNLPNTFRILAGISLMLALIGTALIFPKKSETDQLSKSQIESSFCSIEYCQNLKDALKHPKFYLLLVLVGLTSAFSMFLILNYKEYGLIYIKDDNFLTNIGSIGALINSFSRLFWGFLVDHISFNKLISIINGAFIALALSISFVDNMNEIVFALYFSLTFFFYGSIFSLFPAITYQMFGNKKGNIIYGFVFFGFVFAALLQFAIHSLMVSIFSEKNGFKYAIYGLAALQFISFVIGLKMKFTIDWKQLYVQKCLEDI